MRVARWWLLGVLVLSSAGVVGCDDKDAEAPSDDDAAPRKTTQKKKVNKAGATATASTGAASDAATDPSGWRFVRQTSAMDVTGMDACAFLGGIGVACLDALLAESDPVKKRWMRLLSDADAREAQAALEKGEPMGVAHAEMALFCADSGPCKQPNENGDAMDDGYACLTKAEAALQQSDAAGSVSAHKRACACDSRRAQIPVMGGMLACDDKTPVKRGSQLSVDEAKRIRDCATCEGTRGPAACAQLVDALKPKDPEVAKLVLEQVVPRCQQP